VGPVSRHGSSDSETPPLPLPSKKSSSSSSSSAPIPSLELRRISKRFGETRALSEASLVALPGEIHALLGENGAGKSTLVSIAAGRLATDSGEVLRHGRSTAFRRARDARDAGIALVPQHDLLVGAATVADNLALLDRNAPFFEGARARRARVARLADAFGLELGRPDDRVDTLPVGTRQRIEIAGALAGEPDVLILDEPTAVLSPDETTALFAALRKRADAGAAVILITHRLAEIFAGADRLTLLARGRTVKACRIGETTAAEIGGLLIAGAEQEARSEETPKIFLEGEEGGEPAEDRRGEATGPGGTHPSKHAARSAAGSPVSPGANLDLSRFAPRGMQGKQIDLSLLPGELLVLLAIDGNGADTIASAVAGLLPFTGDVRVGGAALPGSGDPLAFRAAGGAFVPADRREEGLVLDLDIAENLALPTPPGRLFLDRAAMRSGARERMDAFAVRALSPSIRARALSGGNQQKLVLARELAGVPRLVVAIHPTRGLDLAASAAVRARLAGACAHGASALVVTADPDEAFLYRGAVRVATRGALSDALPDGTPLATLGRLMAGLAA
jgi:general nucleoside transport system ATP-binding protein